MKGIITDIEKYRRGWTGGGAETPCGYGSRLAQTEIQRRWIPRMVEEHGIRSIADIGAGDLNWIQHIKWERPVDYRAYDLVPRHPTVTEFDLIHQIPPPADMVLCLWVLNHLPKDHALAALSNLLACECRFIMYTWWPEMYDFLDLGAIDSVVIRQAKNMDYEIRLMQC